MANLFQTKGVTEVTERGTGQKYIYGGIYNDVVIKGVGHGTSTNKGTPYIEVTMYTSEGGPDTARSFQFYFTERAAEGSMSKLKHIATKIVTEGEWEAVQANTIEELAEALDALLRNQHLRMKFVVEQYVNNNNEVKDGARIGFMPFAEATQPGAEHAPIADEDTKLTYDKTNKYDFKPVDVQPDSEEVVAETAAMNPDL